MGHLRGVDQTSIHPAETERLDTTCDEVAHQPLVHRSAQHHFDECQRFSIGDAHAVNIARLDTQLLLKRRDFLAAAVDDDHVFVQQPNHLSELGQECRVVNLVSADFDESGVLHDFYLLPHDDQRNRCQRRGDADCLNATDLLFEHNARQ